jgi:hypothetical protein
VFYSLKRKERAIGRPPHCRHQTIGRPCCSFNPMQQYYSTFFFIFFFSILRSGAGRTEFRLLFFSTFSCIIILLEPCRTDATFPDSECKTMHIRHPSKRGTFGRYSLCDSPFQSTDFFFVFLYLHSRGIPTNGQLVPPAITVTN